MPAAVLAGDPAVTESFDGDDGSWVVSELTDKNPEGEFTVEAWSPNGGINDSGHIQGTRTRSNGVYFDAVRETGSERFTGDLSRFADSDGQVTIRFVMNSTEGKARPEVILMLTDKPPHQFWVYTFGAAFPVVGEVWTDYELKFDPKWTDEDAKANGWNNEGSNGKASFQETVKNLSRFRVGSLVYSFNQTVRLDEVSIGVVP